MMDGTQIIIGFVVGAALAWAIRSELAGRAVAEAQRNAFGLAKSSTPQEYEHWKQAEAFKPVAPHPPPPDTRPWEKHPDFEDIDVDDEREADYVILVDNSGGDGYGRVSERVPRADWNARWGIED